MGRSAVAFIGSLSIGTALAVSPAVPSTQAMARHPAPEPPALDLPAGGVSLPMLDYGGRPVVEVTINARGPYRFILDTGAHMSVVDTGLRSELSLPAAEGTRSAAVSIETMALGETALRHGVAVVMPLGRLLTGEGAPRGVLSAAAFPGCLVTFDFPRRRIEIRSGELSASDGEGTFEYEASEGLPTVPVTVAGTATRVHVDTGSPSGLTLPTRFLDSLPLIGTPRVVGKARTHAGEFPVSRAAVDGPVALGTFRLDLREISFSDVAPGAAPPVGQIGYEVLRRFVVTLDSRNRRIRFEPVEGRAQAASPAAARPEIWNESHFL